MEQLVLFKILAVLLAVVQGAPKDKILGGSEAQPGQFPYTVSIQHPASDTPNNTTCTGTILSKRTILTSGRCLVRGHDTNLLNSVYAGSNSLSQGGTTYGVSGYKIHPEYPNENILTHDLAVLYLSQDLEYSSLIQPIELDENFVGASHEANFSGWGPTYYNGSTPEAEFPDKMQYIRTLTIPDSVCKGNFPPSIEGSYLCLFSGTGKGSCGDIGSPLVRNGKLIGVVSVSAELCSDRYPDSATRVSENFDWIKSVMV